MKTLFLVLLPFFSIAQFRLKLIEPKEIKEGQKISFQIYFEEIKDSLSVNWNIVGNTIPSMSLSSEGLFTWKPDFNTASRAESIKQFDLYIKATAQTDTIYFADSVLVSLIVRNANTPPTVPNSKEVIWIPKANVEVLKLLPKEYYFDDEGDAVAFRLIDSDYPNLKLQPDGNLSITLNSRELRMLPDTIDFELFELNTEEKLSTKHQLILKRAEVDEAPLVLLKPDSPKYQIEEQDELQIEINVSDENNDLKNFDIYTIPQTAFKINDFLERKSNNLYILHWKPALDFVGADEHSKVFQVVISATDEAKLSTIKQIDVEIKNKINWEIEDKVRSDAYQQVISNATEVYLRLEKTLPDAEKEVRKMLKNKKLKSFAGSTLNTLARNSHVIKNENIKNDLSEYGGIAGDAINISNDLNQIEREYPAEFSQIRRFEKVVDFLKNIYLDTEQFIEVYNNPMNRRKMEFFDNKASLQRKISEANKDTSLQLESLKKEPTSVEIRKVFENF